jgi:hypothetical protein
MLQDKDVRLILSREGPSDLECGCGLPVATVKCHDLRGAKDFLDLELSGYPEAKTRGAYATRSGAVAKRIGAY